MALQIQNYKLSGNEVEIEANGEVYCEIMGVRHSLGTLPNLADTTTYLFGDNIPDTLEYVTSGVLPCCAEYDFSSISVN